MSKPFLKWAGGKYKLVPFIETHIPTKKRKRLIEPFSGSAALSLSLDFERYLLNDINTDLIVLFSNLKTEKHSFIDYAHSFFIPENNNEKKYYDLRDRFNHSTDTIERAALFVYLNRHAFNGLCRYNSKGCFNVPFGRYKSPYFPQQDYNFQLVYKQCLKTTESMQRNPNKENFSSFYENCKSPLANITTIIQNKYSVKAIASASPISGPAPLTVTFDARASRDPSNETIPARNYFWYYRDIDGIDKPIGS